MASIYQLKPHFQAMLRPAVQRLHDRGVTANQVTVAAALLSILLGLLLAALPHLTWLFILVPVWMLLRMALNAVDGMLAREFGQQSTLGAYLNELCDVIADAALYLPFALAEAFFHVHTGDSTLSGISETEGAEYVLVLEEGLERFVAQNVELVQLGHASTRPEG